MRSPIWDFSRGGRKLYIEPCRIFGKDKNLNCRKILNEIKANVKQKRYLCRMNNLSRRKKEG